MFESLQLQASGDINPARFVNISGERTLDESADGTALYVGISTEAAKDTPGLPGASALAAASGDQVTVFGPGRVCRLTAGEAITAGDLLMADAQGRGIDATSTNYVGAIALEAASAAGELIEVLVLSPYTL